MASPVKLHELKTWLSEKPLDRRKLFYGYTQALGFTARDEADDEPLFPGPGEFNDNWDVWGEIHGLISDEALATIVADLEDFEKWATTLIENDNVSAGDWHQAGVDLHYTRNGHGSGFWDGDWSNGAELTRFAKAFGSFEMTGRRDDDGLLTAVYF